MQIIRKQKGGDRKRGLTYGKNINWKPGQMCIGIVHGIGEKGNETTELHKPDRWGEPDGGWHILQRLGDKYGFNIMYCQSQVGAHDTIDEISYMLEQAVEDPDMQADPDLLALVGLSWGGRRLKLYASKGFPGKYKPFCITRLAAGWVSVDDWTPTISHNIPTLLVHSEADAVVPETNSSTSFVEGRKASATAPIYYVELKDDPKYTDEHNITRVLNDTGWGADLIDTAYMNPKMSWLQWVLMNSWSEQPVSIESAFVPKPTPAPIPVPPVAEIPVEETPPIEPELPTEPTQELPDDDDAPEVDLGAVFLRGAWVNPDSQRGGDMVKLFWSDDEKGELIRAGIGEQIVSVYPRLLVRTGDKMLRITITFEKGGVKNAKVYGPYKQ